MTRSLHWQDAMDAASALTDTERRILLLLARLPFLPAKAIQQLVGLRDVSYVYRRMALLNRAVDVIEPAAQPGHSAGLYYLTDLGLATIGVDRGVEPGDLGRRLHVRRDDLLDLLPHLSHLAACYRLLGTVAASRPGQPVLLAWQRPWRMRFDRPTVKAPVTIQVPAYAAFAWGKDCAEYLLIPDRATFPLRVYRRVLDNLIVLRQLQDGELPPLVIATPNPKRVAMWKTLLEEVSEKRLDEPLAAYVTTCRELAKGLELPALEQHRTVQAVDLIQGIPAKPLHDRSPNQPLPNRIQLALTLPTRVNASDHLGRHALALSPSDRALLDFIGRHPFLTADDIAVVMCWTSTWARYQRKQLMELGLVRLLQADEVGEQASAMGLTELTMDGLALVAAEQGLSVAAAIRYNGLVGGGPERDMPVRRKLLQNLTHTLGVNAIFVGLYRTAQHRCAKGNKDGVGEWRSPAACSNRLIRPDGYAVYRYNGVPFGFFLEYDRGTMSMAKYYAKFAAYYTYMERGLFERDYEGMPTVLVVTTDVAAESRIVRAAREVSVGRETHLPLLVTCEWRLRDSRNTDGLLEPIWREACKNQGTRFSLPICNCGNIPTNAASLRR